MLHDDVHEADPVRESERLVGEPAGSRSASSSNTASMSFWFSSARSGLAWYCTTVACMRGSITGSGVGGTHRDAVHGCELICGPCRRSRLSHPRRRVTFVSAPTQESLFDPLELGGVDGRHHAPAVGRAAPGRGGLVPGAVPRGADARAGGGLAVHRRRASTPWSPRPPARARRWPASSWRSTGSYLAHARGLPVAGTRVVYVSPLKALAVDIAENLERPLAEIAAKARRLGLAAPDLTIGVRTGDTTASERAAMVRSPADVRRHHAGVALPPRHRGEEPGHARARSRR